MTRRILVTGGAGFVGSTLAIAFKRDHPDWRVAALDNLKRRGSELAVDRLGQSGVAFTHGDIRDPADLDGVGPLDLLVDCSAEASVHAGYGASPRYLIDTNLAGTINCLEHLRRQGGDLVFLSTSRVYPIAGLRALPLERRGDRLALPDGAGGPGWSTAGIAETFPLVGSRSLYGATKLASELMIEEYRDAYGLRAVINRCGVLAGPWQFGKVDQGFVALWMARHVYGGPLAFTGFGGDGLQVRDVLHVEDLYDLVALQAQQMERWSGGVHNVGGGPAGSLSLRELTAMCFSLTGINRTIDRVAETRPADVPYYVSDIRSLKETAGWQPRRDLAGLLAEVQRWLVDDRRRLEPLLSA